MWKIFNIFDEYGGLGSNRQFTYSGDKDWNWLKIYFLLRKKSILSNNKKV